MLAGKPKYPPSWMLKTPGILHPDGTGIIRLRCKNGEGHVSIMYITHRGSQPYLELYLPNSPVDPRLDKPLRLRLTKPLVRGLRALLQNAVRSREMPNV